MEESQPAIRFAIMEKEGQDTRIKESRLSPPVITLIALLVIAGISLFIRIVLPYDQVFVDGAVYFNVLANGTPYLLGTERMKGSHSMSGYHSIELAYLAAVYTNLLNTKQPLDLYFKPLVNGSGRSALNVQPDILPPGSARISDVWIDDVSWGKFDAEKFTVELPTLDYRPKVRVRLVPNE